LARPAGLFRRAAGFCQEFTSTEGPGDVVVGAGFPSFNQTVLIAFIRFHP
jgi:hypothetical protein